MENTRTVEAKEGVIVNKLFFSSRRRHTRYWRDWSSDVCSSDLVTPLGTGVDNFWDAALHGKSGIGEITLFDPSPFPSQRSEERRVGKECRSRWSPYH